MLTLYICNLQGQWGTQTQSRMMQCQWFLWASSSAAHVHSCVHFHHNIGNTLKCCGGHEYCHHGKVQHKCMKRPVRWSRLCWHMYFRTLKVTFIQLQGLYMLATWMNSQLKMYWWSTRLHLHSSSIPTWKNGDSSSIIWTMVTKASWQSVGVKGKNPKA